MTDLKALAVEGASAEIIFVSIDKLIPYARNAREHSVEQVLQIAASIEEFGFTNPVIADDKSIVAGHGRVMAARRIYDAGNRIKTPNGSVIPEKTVPVIDCSGWSDAKRRAYILADNQLALNASWDEAALALEVKDLDEMGFDLPLIGFDEKTLVELLDEKPETKGDPEHVPDAPVQPTTKRGDVWILGMHRLVCGDSTNADDVAKALNGAEPHLMITDPPYSSGAFQDAKKYGSTSVGKLNAPTGDKGMKKDNLSSRGYVDLIRRVAQLSGAQCAYCFTDWRMWPYTADTLESALAPVRSMIVWKKPSPGIGGRWRPQHELIAYCDNAPQPPESKFGNVLEFSRQKSEKHPTVKPVELIKSLVFNSAKGAVYEPFAGSGTTLIACEMEGRICHAIEIEPKYCDVIIQRWQQTFDGEAVREVDGVKYNDIAFDKAPTTDESSKSQVNGRKKGAKSTRRPRSKQELAENGDPGPKTRAAAPKRAARKPRKARAQQ